MAGRFLVAEISKSYRGGETIGADWISERFEHVINANHERGYRLHSFALHQVMVSQVELNETIIAVFERPEMP